MSKERYQYFVVSQKKSEDLRQEIDDKTYFAVLHNYLMSSFAKTLEERSRSENDILQKGISGLRGVLSPFLSTPLTSDKSDIDNAIKDNFLRMMQLSGKVFSTDPLHLETYRVLDSQNIPLHRQIVGVIRRLLKNSRTHLADAGVSFGKNFGDVYLTRIEFDDVSAIPEIASALYSIPKEVKFDDSDFWCDGINMIVHTGGTGRISSEHIMMLQWDGDDAMALSLQQRLVVLSEQFGITNTVVSKKAFISGFGYRYSLQCPIQLNKHAIGSVIVSLIGDDDTLEDAITTRGSLFVLQKIL